VSKDNNSYMKSHIFLTQTNTDLSRIYTDFLVKFNW